ncbi:hypothetical protein AVEN_234699-1 [Araneus ventricosus]|uniref:Uncharacterized protein n=1 Tax=Araneus ventricosus TaxID=182803 RepID=A0A4Y2WUM3_ARAVE|nr:hypothetical protein AVEN_234699-1 [Araneus ventricosus]
MTLAAGANGESVLPFISGKNPLNITTFQMNHKEGKGRQINLDGWAGFSKLHQTFYKAYQSHQREACPASSGQSSASSRLTNIGLVQ